MVYHPQLLYWIPKLHKTPYKQWFITKSSSSTTPLSKLLTIILSKIKDGLKRYTEAIYSRNSVYQMLILKNSKELLEHLKFKAISKVSSIKTFHPLYNNSHEQLKSRLSGLISSFMCKNGSRRYKYVVVKYNTAYFVKDEKVTPQINIQRLILFE